MKELLYVFKYAFRFYSLPIWGETTKDLLYTLLISLGAILNF